MEHHTCMSCHIEWTRQPTRGRVPKLCPTCRDNLRMKNRRAGTCPQCGAFGIRSDGTYCSRTCAGLAKRRPQRMRVWTAGRCRHCEMAFISRQPSARYCSVVCKEQHRAQAVPKVPYVCAWCEAPFLSHQSQALYCSERCRRRVSRTTRRAREHHAAGAYTWAEVIRLFLKAGRRCAYCDQVLDGQPDPDHVVPLSKGGSNSLSNIVPACHRCNGDKRDLSLEEWAISRAVRGLPPVRTTWQDTDPRFTHLSVASYIEAIPA